MVDLIITDSNHVDVRSAADFTLDCAWGKEENDFELVVSGASTIDAGAYIYVDGSECGGVVDAMEDQLTAGVSTLTYSGRTWHGVLANKILEPDRGQGLSHSERYGQHGHRLAHQPCRVGFGVRRGCTA